MTDTLTIETGTVHACRDPLACDVCAVEHRDPAKVGRSALRLAASVRAAIRRADREVREIAGYRILATSPGTVRTISDAAERVARTFAGIDSGDVASKTLAKVAAWIGSDDIDPAKVERLISDRTYARRLGGRVARQLARTMATGGGSMPRLKVDPDDTRKRVKRTYLDRGLPGPDIVRTGTGARRGLTVAEREQLDRVSQWERVEASPAYSPWTNAFGDGMPNVGTSHPFGSVAPGIPERDADVLRRGTLLERVATIGPDPATLPALAAIRDAIASGDPWTWKGIAAAIGDTRHPANLARRVRTDIDRMRHAERSGDLFHPVPGPVPVRVGYWPYPTGRHVGRGDGIGRSVTWVMPDPDPDRRPFRQSHTYEWSGATVDWEREGPEAFDHPIPDPYIAIRRRLRLALWDRVTSDTDPAKVRGILSGGTGVRPDPIRRPIP